MKRMERGLTLIEMMVVIMLIGMLMVFIGKGIFDKVAKSKVDLTRLQMEDLQKQMELFNLYEKRYPANLDELLKPSKALLGKPYVDKKDQLKDRWGGEFSYRIPGSGSRPFDLSSFGSDKRQGGEGEAADLSVWDEE